MAGKPILNSISEKYRRFFREHPYEELRPIDVVRGTDTSTKMVYSFLTANYQGLSGLMRKSRGIYFYDPSRDTYLSEEERSELKALKPRSNGRLGTGRPNQASKRSTAGSDTGKPRSSFSRTDRKPGKTRLVQKNGQKVLVLKKKRTQKK
ncbi:MAG TPA: hypothetical protein VM715_12065 [Candidatus Acidoferrum sp.]|nr:hypothetical protein [Candidatus Acidoferrum sp.]